MTSNVTGTNLVDTGSFSSIAILNDQLLINYFNGIS